MRTVIGNEAKVGEELVKAMLQLRPSISISGNKLNLTHKKKDFTIPLTKVYAAKNGFVK